jgi:hypothetical protein
VGPYLQSPLLSVHPFQDKKYEHLEYFPLVNARAHMLGKDRKILNNRFAEQYKSLCRILCYKPRKKFDAEDIMAVTYYLLLQDRVEEAQQMFESITSDVEPKSP